MTVRSRLCLYAGMVAALVPQTAFSFDRMCPQHIATPPTGIVSVRTEGMAAGVVRDKGAGRIATGTFKLEGRGVIIGSFVVTAAHVVIPDKVEVMEPFDEHVPLVRVLRREIYVAHAHNPPLWVQVTEVYLNRKDDLAILAISKMDPIPVEPQVTWWQETGAISDRMVKDKCVAVLVPPRHGNERIDYDV
ncbi:MAG: hypothetical protein U1A28_04965, partial [Patescibacteria group bacterium]|nr:hypothetical protein [Patescibacteria group bacterium]